MPAQRPRRYLGPLKAVVLDWAGTTVDYGCMAPVATFMQAFADSGVPITVAEARGPMGTPKWHHIQARTQMTPLPRDGRQPTASVRTTRTLMCSTSGSCLCKCKQSKRTRT